MNKKELWYDLRGLSDIEEQKNLSVAFNQMLWLMNLKMFLNGLKELKLSYKKLLQAINSC